MVDRMTREENWGRAEFVLTNAKAAVKGEVACFDTSTGEVTIGEASTTLFPIGYFAESKTGDGTATVLVRLFREAKLHWWDNDDSPNDVAAADIGSEVYIKDGRTVSTSSAGSTRSKAGRVWGVHSQYGVLLEAGLAVTGPTGASGSALSGGGVADRAALKAVAAASRFNGQLVMVRTDGSLWRFISAGTADEDEAQDLVLEPDAGTGRWVRADKTFTIKAPVAAAMADGATILTVPAGFVLRLAGLPYYDITTSFTGGSSSAIGIASSISGYNTAGDILGGATGDVLAGLAAGVRPGTVGAKLDTEAERQAFLLQGADTLTYEEITSAFTAGAGFVCIPVVAMTPA